ncbi:hypothetical protein XFF6166_920042 [Xanthomonas citri pv. fuscans]|nr:hypothetical protein XFF6166_920042 [Xanthomonas citri pv. fuscans]SOO03767.1 hypothetical protein XFF6960_890077 [Xanthomonas citri pv. fuscans]SOO05008.1 hypothetical protein XFF7767_340078 [Xanthomonas citri pv. fuscans]SOO10682.1 hypothetical protein XFF6970_600042 [Xanthomonas citri pv. fuscans]SOO46186.1 hypothetical protein XFF1815_980077 [Xanthomonas citri pv. fuscans]
MRARWRSVCPQAWTGARSACARQCHTALVGPDNCYRLARWLANLNCFILLRIGVGAPRRSGRSPARMPNLFSFGG